jgi:hypothetical protein
MMMVYNPLRSSYKFKILSRIMLLVGLILVIPLIAFSQFENNVVLNAQVDKTETPLDKDLKLTVTLSWNKDKFDITFDSIDPPNCENLSICGNYFSSDAKASPKGQIVSNNYGFILKPQNVGSGTIGPVSLTYTDNKTGEQKTLATTPIKIIVAKPLSDKLYPFKVAAKYLIIVLLIAIIGFFIFKYLKKRREARKILQELKSQPTMEDEYKEKLQSLYPTRQTMGNKEFCSKVSQMLKRYLEEKFDLKLMGATTDKIITTLGSIDLLNQDIVDLLMSIFDFCDKVKFAGNEPDKENVDNLKFKAETFISSMNNLVNTDDRGKKDEPGNNSNK